jgi:Fe-S-cluster-containing dehydrogenase component
MSYAFFIDTDRCTGCRGCQVACKQWHDLPAEETQNRGGLKIRRTSLLPPTSWSACAKRRLTAS